MSWQRSFWFRVPLTKQLKQDYASHREVTINNVATVISVTVSQPLPILSQTVFIFDFVFAFSP